MEMVLVERMGSSFFFLSSAELGLGHEQLHTPAKIVYIRGAILYLFDGSIFMGGGGQKGILGRLELCPRRQRSLDTNHLDQTRLDESRAKTEQEKAVKAHGPLHDKTNKDGWHLQHGAGLAFVGPRQILWRNKKKTKQGNGRHTFLLFRLSWERESAS